MGSSERSENIKFLKAEYGDIFPKIKKSDVEGLLKVMEKYKDNKWWLSDDYKTIAYYYLESNSGIVRFDRFQTCVEKLLGMGVSMLTFAFGREKLLAAAKIAIETGKQPNDEQAGMMELGAVADLADKVGKDRIMGFADKSSKDKFDDGMNS